MVDWTPPDNYYNLHVIGGIRFAIDWPSGEKLSARLTQLKGQDVTGRTELPAFEEVVTVEGSALHVNLVEINLLEESTTEQRQRWIEFRKARKAEGSWDDDQDDK